MCHLFFLLDACLPAWGDCSFAHLSICTTQVDAAKKVLTNLTKAMHDVQSHLQKGQVQLQKTNSALQIAVESANKACKRRDQAQQVFMDVCVCVCHREICRKIIHLVMRSQRI